MMKTSTLHIESLYCTYIFWLSWICRADVSKNEYGSIHVYSCWNIYQHQYEDMRGQNVSCRLSCFVQLPGSSENKFHTHPTRGKWWSITGFMWTQMCYLKTSGTRQFWQYLYLYIYNLLKLWGQILKCEVISSMFYVQPLTYCINL